MSNRILFVGLGNPGKRYKNTRHNIGFIVLEYFINTLSKKTNVRKDDYKFNSIIHEFFIDQNIVLCVFPLTFMNLSGIAIKQIVDYYKINDTKNNLVVISDDMDIDLGKFKLRINGGDGGHNGIRSIIDHIGKDFARVRVGISRPSDKNYKQYVLEDFSPDEMIKINEILPILSLVLYNIISEGFYLTMSKQGIFLRTDVRRGEL